MTGGGSLIRMGCHPLSTVLYLKQVEALSRGERIAVSGVTADVGHVAACLPPQERPFINANPVDVEDWGMLTLTFSDGTKSTVFSGDMIMGGVRNVVETYTSGGALFANITPNDHMTSYLTDEEKLAGVYITEKVERRAGNSSASRGVDARLLTGDPGFHGMRVHRAAAPRRSRLGLRNYETQLCRLLVGRRGATHRAVGRIERAYASALHPAASLLRA
jgi:predicted dehydrogenase